jgi:hypothetical protein
LLLIALSSGGFVKQGDLNLINLGTYVLAILVWLGYSVSRKSAREGAVNHLQTQRWEQGLADLQQPAFSDSLIPMFEGMVERAFSEVRIWKRKINSRPSAPAALPGPTPRSPVPKLGGKPAPPRKAALCRTLSRGF